ncbi:Hypothetical protein D9617_30g011750 [Elsinoe fawcettii]|nr:Hypothetical protein D9617_30g011750 [Elsinoe fawcettii]
MQQQLDAADSLRNDSPLQEILNNNFCPCKRGDLYCHSGCPDPIGTDHGDMGAMINGTLVCALTKPMGDESYGVPQQHVVSARLDLPASFSEVGIDNKLVSSTSTWRSGTEKENVDETTASNHTQDDTWTNTRRDIHHFDATHPTKVYSWRNSFDTPPWLQDIGLWYILSSQVPDTSSELSFGASKAEHDESGYDDDEDDTLYMAQRRPSHDSKSVARSDCSS